MREYAEGYTRGRGAGYRSGCRMTKMELEPVIQDLRKELHEAEDKLKILSIDVIFDDYPIPTPYDIKNNKNESLEGKWVKQNNFWILRIKL